MSWPQPTSSRSGPTATSWGRSRWPPSRPGTASRCRAGRCCTRCARSTPSASPRCPAPPAPSPAPTPHLPADRGAGRRRRLPPRQPARGGRAARPRGRPAANVGVLLGHRLPRRHGSGREVLLRPGTRGAVLTVPEAHGLGVVLFRAGAVTSWCSWRWAMSCSPTGSSPLTDRAVPSSRQASEHLLHRQAAQHLRAAEQLISRRRQLTRAVGRTDPAAARPAPAARRGSPTRGRSRAHRDPVGVVRAPVRPGQSRHCPSAR